MLCDSWWEESPGIAHVHSCRYIQANKPALCAFFSNKKRIKIRLYRSRSPDMSLLLTVLLPQAQPIFITHQSQRRSSLFSLSKVFPAAGVRSRQILGSGCCQPHTFFFITFLLWQSPCRCMKHPNSSAICQPSKPEQFLADGGKAHKTDSNSCCWCWTPRPNADQRRSMQINAADGERAIRIRHEGKIGRGSHNGLHLAKPFHPF